MHTRLNCLMVIPAASMNDLFRVHLPHQDIKFICHDKNVLKNNCTFIEIKHYEKDKLLKTETYPLTHFLEGFENEFKRVRYN